MAIDIFFPFAVRETQVRLKERKKEKENVIKAK